AVAVVTVVIIDLAVVMFFAFYRRPIAKADAIVVLGAAINTPSLYNRSLQGLKLYRAGDAPEIVVSGGQDFAGSQTEAAYMQKVILQNSKSAVPIVAEDQSHSTYENL